MVTSRTRGEKEGGDSFSQVPVFHPTEEEFSDFRRYISEVVTPGAKRFGLARVVPPKGWSARPTDPAYADLALRSVEISAPLSQHVEGGPVVFQQRHEAGNKTSIAQFAEKMKRVGSFRFGGTTQSDTDGAGKGFCATSFPPSPPFFSFSFSFFFFFFYNNYFSLPWTTFYSLSAMLLLTLNQNGFPPSLQSYISLSLPISHPTTPQRKQHCGSSAWCCRHRRCGCHGSLLAVASLWPRTVRR